MWYVYVNIRPHLLSLQAQKWSLDDVCGWAEAIKRQISSNGKMHPADREAGMCGGEGGMCE